MCVREVIFSIYLIGNVQSVTLGFALTSFLGFLTYAECQNT